MTPPRRPRSAARLRAWLRDNNPGLPRVVDLRRLLGRRRRRGTRRSTTPASSPCRGPTEIGGHDLPTVYEVIARRGAGRGRRAARDPASATSCRGSSSTAARTSSSGSCPGSSTAGSAGARASASPTPAPTSPRCARGPMRDGDDFVITGHKVWTSYSDVADWCLVLARTDPDVPKHKGLSAFVVSMDQPGIEQRPLRMINGITPEFGEVLFDGVRVPAANMIGDPGDGLAPGHDRGQPRARAGRARLRRPLQQDGQPAGRPGPRPTRAAYSADQVRDLGLGDGGGRDAPAARLSPAVRPARRDLPTGPRDRSTSC